mgnify:FL=1
MTTKMDTNHLLVSSDMPTENYNTNSDTKITASIDNIFVQINEFGMFQKIFAMYMAYMIAATGMVSMSFIILGRKEVPILLHFH